MKKILLLSLFILLSFLSFSQTILSWNIQNLGETKYKRDSVITQICDVIKSSNADIVAIQEVITGPYGDSCIIKISKIIDYNYTLSARTTGNGAERYAYLYRKSIKLNYSKLDVSLQDSINREPFVASFKINNKDLIIREVHLVPTSKTPQKEVEDLYQYKSGIICGDFNLTCKHLIYIPMLKYFNSPLCGQGTSLKRDGSTSENNYDHFFVDKTYKILESKVFIYPYRGNRNTLSDHLPILIKLKQS
jgi:endonuclease/exonuclease/phosphatase family metal-dependent hydrolase